MKFLVDRRAERRLVAWLPALLGAALYLINLSGTWIYDDLYFAHDDPRLHDVHRWPEFLTQGYMDGGADSLWRPLVSLSYAVQWRLHGERAWPFHLVNLLLHGGVCALVARLGQRLSGRNGAGLAAGLLFAAHPIHVEAVAGIVGRAEEMCALGVLGALLLVVDRDLTFRRAVAVTACFLLAALSKEQGVLLPFMLLGWAIVRRFSGSGRAELFSRVACDPRPARAMEASGRGSQATRLNNSADDTTAALPLIAMLSGGLAIFISYRNRVAPWFWEKGFLDWTINPIVRAVGRDRWLMPIAILGRYAALLVAPWRLAPDYSAMVFTPVQHLADPYLWLGAATLVGGAAVAILAIRRRDRTMLFCLGCLGITYFLASNLIAIGTIFGERLMYLPSAFASIMVAHAVFRPGAVVAIRVAMVAIVLVAFCLRTETYAWQWNDRLRFYRYAFGVQPKSAQVIVLLGDELERRGNNDAAERTYAIGRAMCPGSWRAWDLSARLALRRGKLDDALRWARESLRLRPSPETAELVGQVARKMSDR